MCCHGSGVEPGISGGERRRCAWSIAEADNANIVWDFPYMTPQQVLVWTFRWELSRVFILCCFAFSLQFLAPLEVQTMINSYIWT